MWTQRVIYGWKNRKEYSLDFIYGGYNLEVESCQPKQDGQEVERPARMTYCVEGPAKLERHLTTSNNDAM